MEKAERNFYEVLGNVMDALPPELGVKLHFDAAFWAYEIRWEMLSEWVFYHLRPSSTDQISIAVYATLTGVSPAEMKQRFIENGD